MTKKSLKERMKDKQADLKARGGGGNIVFLKADQTIRVRILNMGEEADFIKETTQFYLGGEIKGVISPATFDEPCALYDAYQELKSSKDDDSKKLSEKFNIRKRYLAFVLIYKDLKGNELAEGNPKFILLTNGMYQDILEYYLDEDEWGDMTNPEKGYDLKLKRTGSGKTDTEYMVTPCSRTKLPKEFAKKVYDLDEEVRKIIPTYEETKNLLNKFLGEEQDEDEDKGKGKESLKEKREKRRKRNKDDE